MKTCKGCKKAKVIDEFNYKDKERNTRQSQCKDCTRLQVRSHYYAKRAYYINKAHERSLKIRKQIKNYLWNYLSKHACVDCGESDIIVLEFDHVRDKVYTISEMINQRTSLQTVIKEVSKCDVRCANCHRRKTAKEFNWEKSYARL